MSEGKFDIRNLFKGREALQSRQRFLSEREFVDKPEFIVIGREPVSDKPEARFLRTGDTELDTHISRIQGTLTINPDRSITLVSVGTHPIEVLCHENEQDIRKPLDHTSISLNPVDSSGKLQEYTLLMPQTPNRPGTQVRLAANVMGWLVETGLETL